MQRLLAPLVFGQAVFAAAIPPDAACSFTFDAYPTTAIGVVEDAASIGSYTGFGMKDGRLYNNKQQVAYTHVAMDHDRYLTRFGDKNWLVCRGVCQSGDGTCVDFFSPTKSETTGCIPALLRIRDDSAVCAIASGEDRAGRAFASKLVDLVPSRFLQRLFRPSGSAQNTGDRMDLDGDDEDCHDHQDTLLPPALHVPTAKRSAAACPTDLSSGTFQFPHLIVPTSPGAPNTSFGNSYQAYISKNATTLFNFDIPAGAPYAGTCALLFLFPYGSDLDPSAGKFFYSGQEQVVEQDGGIDFSLLSGTANAQTSYSTTPSIGADYGKVAIIPGNNYTVATFPCPQNQAITIKAKSVNETELDYFQDSAPMPIGLYVVPCS